MNTTTRTEQAKAAINTAQSAGQVAARPTDKLGALISRIRPQLEAALPRHMNPDRMARVMLTELRTNEKLAMAAMQNPLSFAGAMLRASQLGLEVGNGLGHCYLLPFEKRRKIDGQWQTVAVETQLIIGYKGMIDLARRSGQIESIYATEVYAGEHFKVTLGLNPGIEHERSLDNDGKAESVIAVYAVAKLQGGGFQFEVMGRNQIEAIRARSKSKDDGPWITDWIEMAKKTVTRRLFKYLPVSIEMRDESGTTHKPLEAILQNDDGHTFSVDTTTGEVTPEPLGPDTPDTPATPAQKPGEMTEAEKAAAVAQEVAEAVADKPAGKSK